MVGEHGTIQALALINHGEGREWIAWAAVIGLCTIAAAFDVRQARIPNLLTGPAWLGGMVWAAAVGGWPQFGNALAASVLLALPFIIMFMFALGGAGDAKLMATIGAWLGLGSGLQTLLLIVLAGGILGFAAAILRGRLLNLLANLRFMTLWMAAASHFGIWSANQVGPPPLTDVQRMPYAVPILVGVCLAAGGVRLWS